MKSYKYIHFHTFTWFFREPLVHIGNTTTFNFKLQQKTACEFWRRLNNRTDKPTEIVQDLINCEFPTNLRMLCGWLENEELNPYLTQIFVEVIQANGPTFEDTFQIVLIPAELNAHWGYTYDEDGYTDIEINEKSYQLERVLAAHKAKDPEAEIERIMRQKLLDMYPLTEYHLIANDNKLLYQTFAEKCMENKQNN